MSETKKTGLKESATTAPADRKEKTSAVRRAVSSLATALTTLLPPMGVLKKSSFPGKQYSTRFYETATALIKDLGSYTSKDLEFAAMLDRIYAQPTFVEFAFTGSAMELPHGLSKAPRFVVPVAMDQTTGTFGWMLIGWDDTNIKAAGLDGTNVRFACYP